MKEKESDNKPEYGSEDYYKILAESITPGLDNYKYIGTYREVLATRILPISAQIIDLEEPGIHEVLFRIYGVTGSPSIIDSNQLRDIFRGEMEVTEVQEFEIDVQAKLRMIGIISQYIRELGLSGNMTNLDLDTIDILAQNSSADHSSYMYNYLAGAMLLIHSQNDYNKFPEEIIEVSRKMIEEMSVRANVDSDLVMLGIKRGITKRVIRRLSRFQDRLNEARANFEQNEPDHDFLKLDNIIHYANRANQALENGEYEKYNWWLSSIESTLNRNRRAVADAVRFNRLEIDLSPVIEAYEMFIVMNGGDS